MSCITTNTLDMRSIYPVLDPRRTAGPGPSFAYGYNFASDGVEFDVNRLVGLPACEMFVNFTTTLTEGKQVTAFNLFNNGFTLSVGSSSLGLPSSMHIKKASCESGVDTIVLCRDYAWPQGMTAVYTFMPNDFWDFWGGCAINIRWVTDTMGSGLWGNQVPQPVYPLVRFPDGTVMVSPSGSGFLVIFGGAGFAADANFLAMGGPLRRSHRAVFVRSCPARGFHPGSRNPRQANLRGFRGREILASAFSFDLQRWIELQLQPQPGPDHSDRWYGAAPDDAGRRDPSEGRARSKGVSGGSRPA
jgi:hypothetical protein